MEFKRELRILETKFQTEKEVQTYDGNVPILLTALETTNIEEDGNIILAEDFLIAIARYVAARTNSSYFIKIRHTDDKLMTKLFNYIYQHKIKLVFEITGTNDLENNVTIKINNRIPIDYSLTKEIEESFKELNISKVKTEIVNNKMDFDLVTLEINREYRNIEESEKIEKICNAIINFIEQYSNYID